MELAKVYSNPTVTQGENGTYTVGVPEGNFIVNSNGSVEKKSGVLITTKPTKIKKGEKIDLTATLDGVTGNITWETSDSDVISVTSSGRIEGKADSGRATITAKIDEEHKDEFIINIAQKITAISVEDITVSKNNTAQIVVTTTPTGIVEDMTYTFSSDKTNIATVNENTGLVTGVATGEATITITSTTDNTITTSCTVTVTRDVGHFKTVEGVAYYYPRTADTNGVAITASNMKNYLGKEVEYTPENPSTNYGTSITYRLFYVDVEGKYGDGAGSIYLKADCDGKDVTWRPYKDYDKGTSGDSSDLRATMFKLNPGMNGAKEDDEHDCGIAWMTDPEQWKDWIDETITLKSNNTTVSGINYVVGGPSLEMYVDSYNAYLDGYTENNVIQIYKNESITERAEKLACEYVTSGYNGKGYIIGFAGTAKASWANTGYYQEDNSLFAYNAINGQQIYNPGNSTNNSLDHGYWLASPSASGSTCAMSVIGKRSSVYGSSYYNGFDFCPLVSIKSGVNIQEK